MEKIAIINALIINEGKRTKGTVIINNGVIEHIIANDTSKVSSYNATRVIDAEGLFLIPGVIDDQVHFREPGLTHKGDIYTESKAGVAGEIGRASCRERV